MAATIPLPIGLKAYGPRLTEKRQSISVVRRGCGIQWEPPRLFRPRKGTIQLPSALAISVLLHTAAVLFPIIEKESGHAGEPRAHASPALTATLGAAPNPDKIEVAVSPPNNGTAPDDRPLSDAKSLESYGGLGVLPIPAPAYYPAGELTKQPQAVAVAELNVPEIQALAASGNLILKLWIDNQGTVVDAAAEESGLPEAFARTAVEAFRQSRFLPGERNGVPVGAVIRIEVSYEDAPVRRP